MESSTNKIRSASYLYSIQSHMEYLFAVGCSTTEQAFFFMLDNFYYNLFFDNNGDLIRIQHYPIAKTKNLEKYLEKFEQLVIQSRKQNNMGDGTIHVKRFFINNLKVGIKDFPDYLLDYLLNPNDVNETEKSELNESVRTWKEEDLFVLWVGQSFFVDSNGNVTSS